MRISTATIASALLILPLAASVQADDGRVYYKGGTRIEAGDTELKLNVQLQPRYGYVDFDSDRNQEEISEFSLRRARWIASGKTLDGMVSFKLNQDFSSNSGGSDLKDAWIQLNNEMANLRLGQYKVPFSRQYRNSSTKLFFIERSDVTNIYDRDRDRGLMVHGMLGPVNYAAGVFNGEGRNARSDDTDHRWAASLDFSSPEYNRGHEGDLDGGPFGFTVGTSVVFEQDKNEDGDLDAFALSGDVGARCSGVDVQAEIFFEEFDVDGAGDDPSFFGFYTQATYTMGKVGVGARYGFSDEEDAGELEDTQEFSGVVNYFLNGHALKAQAQVSFFNDKPVGGSSLNDFLVLAQLTGVF